MRVAVLADIHGNSVALDAVLADIVDQGGVDRYCVLGDLVALGHDPHGVLDRLHALEHASFVRGNTDRYVITGERPFPPFGEAEVAPDVIKRWSEAEASFSWTQGAVSAHGSFDWLSDLALDVRFVAEDGSRVLGVHASPGRDDGDGVYPGQSEDDLRKSFAGCEADLVFVGHTHMPVDRVVEGVRIVNPGSVSNHLGPDVTAKWALLETTTDGCAVTLRSVAYDNGAVLDALERVRHPGREYLARFMRGEMESPWPFSRRPDDRSE